MYSSGYSQVSKHSLQAQKKMQYHSKGKSCGYYMRIVFFFSSLIQSLIIVSLVLFLIYGKKQDSASSSRIQDLEESFTRLSIENVELRQQRKNLTRLLNTTLTEKARNDWDLARLRYVANISTILIHDMDKKLQQCGGELLLCKSTSIISGRCQPIPGNCNCGMFAEQLRARLDLVTSNFTQTTERMRREMDQIAKDRDNLNLQVISLRRDKFTHEKEVEFCRQKCKADFAQSLSGISNVTKAFLQKVDTLFPVHIAFQLTCPKQRDHLEQIRTNCSSLSGEIEDKFQHYLNNVGEQVSAIQSENSRLKAENWRLSDDYRWCSQNRTGMIQQHKQNLDKLQRKHDEDKERLLMDKMRLNGELQVLDNNVKYKSKEVEHLREQLKQLNMTCMAKVGFGGFTGGSTSRIGPCQSGGLTGICSPGSSLNKPVSPGTGSLSTSLLSSGSSSSTGLGYNRFGSTGTGSSSSSVLSSGSSSSTGYSKPGSTGLNPSGTGLNKPAVSGRGSSIPGSTSGSTGSTSSLSSSGTGSNKPAINVKTSSGTGSSSGSTGSTSKSGSNSFSWLGFGSSSSGQSKPGTGTGKGTSTGTGYGGIGSSAGAGRTSGSVSVAQHLQDLQRLINPPGPEEKQDLSRMLG